MNAIQKTNKYNLFKHVNSNREVNTKHVKALMKAIQEKDMLSLNPILVNAKMQVIDGQHRLEAAKRLKRDIYYIVDDKIAREDISKLNSNKKNWGVSDYLNYHLTEKKPGFDVLYRLRTEFPFIPVTTALILLCGFQNGLLAKMKDGIINVRHEEEAWEFAKKIEKFNKTYAFAIERSFIMALLKMHQHKDFNYEYLLNKIADQPRSVVRCVDTKQYLEMFEEIYNYKLSTNRIRF